MNSKKIYIVVITVLILAVLFLSFGSGLTKPNYLNINGAEAATLVDNGAIVVDVRTETEYNSKHIKGAINIPYDEISSIDVAKDKEIILYCQSGSRATKAAEDLIDLGYTKVYNLGALSNWTGETK